MSNQPQQGSDEAAKTPAQGTPKPASQNNLGDGKQSSAKPAEQK